MAILKNIGETDYYIVENIGATITERILLLKHLFQWKVVLRTFYI